jgi:hypothetical protein
MHIERRRCPVEFQDRLTRAFGISRFGSPNFRMVWGQSNLIRLGNLWRDKFGNERRGYRETYQSHCMPCWVIQRWRAPEEYGTPALYYIQNWDPVSKLYTCGEYPWTGRYESLQPLFRHEFVNGKMVIEHFELSHILIDKIIPMMIAAQRLSAQEREAAMQAIKAAETKKETDEITDRMMSNLPSYYGPVSFARQGCRTSLLDKKMEAIQRQWNRLSWRGKRPNFDRGLFQGTKPVPRFVN